MIEIKSLIGKHYYDVEDEEILGDWELCFDDIEREADDFEEGNTWDKEVDVWIDFECGLSTYGTIMLSDLCSCYFNEYDALWLDGGILCDRHDKFLNEQAKDISCEGNIDIEDVILRIKKYNSQMDEEKDSGKAERLLDELRFLMEHTNNSDYFDICEGCGKIFCRGYEYNDSLACSKSCACKVFNVNKKELEKLIENQDNNEYFWELDGDNEFNI